MAVLIPKMPRPMGSALTALANKVGHSLPETYIEFVASHDGAEPEANSIATSDNEVGVSRFIPVHEAVELGAKVDDFPVAAIPFAEDDCGNYFYVNPRSGGVHFWDHEVEGPDEEVASDALVFVEKLARFDASRVVLTPGQVKFSWIDPSFKPEF